MFEDLYRLANHYVYAAFLWASSNQKSFEQNSVPDGIQAALQRVQSRLPGTTNTNDFDTIDSDDTSPIRDFALLYSTDWLQSPIKREGTRSPWEWMHSLPKAVLISSIKCLARADCRTEQSETDPRFADVRILWDACQVPLAVRLHRELSDGQTLHWHKLTLLPAIAIDLAAMAGWITSGHEKAWTDQGKFILEHAPLLGFALSYAPLLARLPDYSAAMSPT